MARYVHKLIKETAIAFAEEVYETYASSNNKFYGKCKDRNVWVSKNWKKYIQPARQTLVQMLGRTDVDEDQKKVIYEAILADRSIPQGNHTPVGHA